MTRRRAPWTEAMFTLLADEQWHPLPAVLEVMTREIEPGRATRVDKPRSDRPPEEEGKPRPGRPRLVRDQTTQIQLGKRRVAMDAIRSQTSGGQVVAKASNGVTQLRLSDRAMQWDTNRLSKHLKRSQSTVQGWFGNPEIVAKVEAELPKGMTAVITDAFGSRRRTTPPEAVPAWEMIARGQRALPADERLDKLVTCISSTFNLDHDESVERLAVFLKALKAADLGIYKRAL